MRVLDSHGRLGGEQLGEFLVLAAELLGADLLGQVEVTEHAMSGADRDTEQGAHRRVVVRETGELGMELQIPQANRLGAAEHDPQGATAGGPVADSFGDFFVDAGVKEALQRSTGAVEHPEGGVARLDDLAGGVDQRLQHLVEGKAAVERHADAHEGLEALDVVILRRAQGRQLLQPLRLALEDVGIVECDRGLSGERFKDLGVAFIEIAILVRVESEDRSQCVVAVIEG